MKLLQTKPQVKNMNFKYFDLYYSLIEKGMRKKLQTINMKLLKTIFLIIMILL